MKNKKIVRQKNGLSFCCFVTLKKIEEKNENRRREREEMKEKNEKTDGEKEKKRKRENAGRCLFAV